jgi:general secretion pathway protein F
MPSFHYEAIAPGGTLSHGVIEAADVAGVVAQLRRRGCIPMHTELATSSRFAAFDMERRRRLRRREVADFSRELAVMLNAGQDLDRGLRFLIETAGRPRVAAVLGELRDAVRDGSAFAAALAQQPASFSRLYVGLVRAGEAGGALAATLERLATLLERERALSDTVISALVYPGVLMLAATGSLVLLLTQVLPQFAALFADSGTELPMSTQLMIKAGDWLGAWGAPVLGMLSAMTVLVRHVLRQPGPRLAFDRLLLWLPVVGSLQREILAARLTRTLGTLLLNGMPLVAALDIIREVLSNSAAVLALEAAAKRTRGGAGLARPLAASGIFPPRTIHLLQLGEETAQLGTLALRAADIHDERTRLAVTRLVALLTPAITIAMGAFVAAILGSLLQVMLGLNDLVH